MKTYNAYIEEYKRFMISFRHAYPELYEKYCKNISMPVKGSARARINNGIEIRPVGRTILTHIITEYYTPLNN